jgi:L-histidine N-alpha-methyltransferase
MHLVSLERQSVTVAGANCRASFHQDESIWTESSQKFTLPALQHMARQASFVPAAHWIDQEWPFAESLWIAE